MKHSEILQLALDKHLAQPEFKVRGRTKYICFALSRVISGQSEEAIRNKNEITGYIRKCLYPYGTVTNWLMRNNYIKSCPDKFQYEQIQLYRKRWMLHLIEEYKKQGR